MTSNDEYIHGTAPEEQRRLTRLNSLLNDSSLSAMKLTGDELILDVGSGLGQFSRAMARTGGAVRVIGVEPDARQLQEARRQASTDGEDELVEFRHGTGNELPLGADEWGTFDVVHARFVLEHVPQPSTVVGEMAKALRPGGRMILEDDDHALLRCWPDLELFDTLWQAYSESYRVLGCDPEIGRRLVALMQAAGLDPIGNDILFFGSAAGHPDHEAIVENMAGVVESAHDLMIGSELATAVQITEGLQAFREWGQRPDSALWYGRCWAEAKRPVL